MALNLSELAIMSATFTQPCTAFAGQQLLAAGPLADVALAVKTAITAAPILVFDDSNGRVIDLDLRGSNEEVLARLAQLPATATPAEAIREPATVEPASAERSGRGRPRLGVVAREVTLLPRHWEWLAAQPGGASVTLRKLIEEARRSSGAAAEARNAQETAYRFMSALAGDLPGFEEATRALFADDRAQFEWQVEAWPEAVRSYAVRLGFGDR